ncbi:MAG: helix-turn-helix domain-containing protein [Bacillota bacterium]|jgi:transcriptional regulator with XRE-family HTH domain
MDELKRIVADHLIRLRQEAQMTQAELGEKLNYSDKTVSKWERGESLPDVFVLKQIAAMFHVTVDMLLTPYEEWTLPMELGVKDRSYSSNMIMLVALVSSWTLALLIFVLLWLCDILFPMIFALMLPVSFVIVLVMNSLWNRGRYNYWIISGLVLSVFLMIYLLMWKTHPWQLLLVAVPAEIVVWLSFHIKRR